MAVYICAHCGATFTDRVDYATHYAEQHPDQPYLNLVDTPVEDEGGRSWGGTDPTDAGRPVNVFEETMEETPEETAEDIAESDEEHAAG